MPKISESKRQENIESIVTSAYKLFSEKGYSRTSVNDIIKEIGMSKSNFYTYFESKDDVFFEMVNQVDDKIIHYARTHLETTNAKERFRDYITFRLERFKDEFSRRQAKFATEYYASVRLSEEREALMQRRYNDFSEDIESIIVYGQQMNLFSEQINMKTMIEVLMGLIDGLIFHDSVLGVRITKQKIQCVADVFLAYLTTHMEGEDNGNKKM